MKLNLLDSFVEMNDEAISNYSSLGQVIIFIKSVSLSYLYTTASLFSFILPGNFMMTMITATNIKKLIFTVM